LAYFLYVLADAADATLPKFIIVMAVQVWILGHSWVLDPTGTGSGLFLHPRFEPVPDPHITGFRCGFHFSLMDAPEKNLKGTQ
jgi:hypothetical protein